MTNQKIETFIYEDLGFPIQLIDVPMLKILGEWVLDINLNKLQIQVLKLLIQQPTPLQAKELRFIRKYLEMTTTAFGEFFGVTHAAVLKWERGQLPSPPMDMCIRMYVMERLHAKDEEFRKLFHKVSMSSLAEAKKNRVGAKVIALHIRKRRIAHS
ncbi:MAG TPA: hypothetical protein VGP47_01505 [Parachlamydiaceae bacterium]|nr:hypothetical protein [Parachlamydiaceae bacterium]